MMASVPKVKEDEEKFAKVQRSDVESLSDSVIEGIIKRTPKVEKEDKSATITIRPRITAKMLEKKFRMVKSMTEIVAPKREPLTAFGI